MLFFLDENFPKKAVPFLNEKGHETRDIRGTPQAGVPDDLIFTIAQENGAVFLTTDRTSSTPCRFCSMNIMVSS